MRFLNANRRRRTGVVLPIVLVALLLVTGFGAAIARSLIAQNQRARQWEWRQQAAWLAESGLQRAGRRLAEEAGYEGETWLIDNADSSLDADAVVHIEVNAASDGSGRLVTVEALYPAKSKRGVAHWCQLTIEESVPEATE